MTTADRMAVLDKGVLQQVGPAAELFDYPANRFVAGFVGTANLLGGNVSEIGPDAVTFQADGIGAMRIARSGEAPGMGPATIAFRPHSVDIRADDASIDPARTWLAGRVESSEFLGELSRYRVRVGEVVLVANQPHRAGLSPLRPGDEVRLGIEPAQLRFLSD